MADELHVKVRRGIKKAEQDSLLEYRDRAPLIRWYQATANHSGPENCRGQYSSSRSTKNIIVRRTLLDWPA